MNKKISLIERILLRNYQLYKENKIYKRLNLCLIKDNDNAFQRNIKAVDYIDRNLRKGNYLVEATKLREMLTTFKTENILDEVNKPNKDK